jgi:hypothetical protein
MTNINPFKPGAGHSPPYLAGRDAEKQVFTTLLKQQVVLNNLIVTGLRGVGKTVLLEEFKPIAQKANWVWAGTEFSESSCINEDTLALRFITDLAPFTSGITLKQTQNIGFANITTEENLNYAALVQLYKAAPGIAADKLKFLLKFVWECLKGSQVKGIVFAYDEAQTMSDHAEKDQYPLSLLLDVFQSIQKTSIPFMLVFAGLPTLFPKLVEARTFAERMFQIQLLNRLDDSDSYDAITKPIVQSRSEVTFSDATIKLITRTSGGYPFFIQFICKELFDVFLQQIQSHGKTKPVPMDEIIKKLDRDFFAGRWARATDRQRELLSVIANLDNSDEEFTVQDIVISAKTLKKPFSASHVNQLLSTLGDAGLIYKNRYSKYAFAVPLLGQFIKRQEHDLQQLELPWKGR